MRYKIVFFMYHMINGGIENVLLNVLDGLYKEYDITVISQRPVTETKFLDYFKEHNIRLYIYNSYLGAPRPKNFFKRKFQYFKRWLNKKRLQKICNNYDLLIDYFNGAAFEFIRNAKKPKVLFPHCSVDAFMLNKSANIKKMLKTYDKIICISNSFYQTMVTRYPKFKNKFTCIYNPINVSKIHESLGTSKPIKSDKKYFISVARLHKDKDHETLLRAFALFLQKNNIKDVKLYLCGSGPLFNQYQHLVNQLKISQNVVFMGDVKNPYIYMRYAMANILSSHSEGLPTVLIEGQALGVLNIASQVECGISEILLDGRAGLLFTSQDATDLANKLSDVYHNKVDKKNLLTNATKGLSRFDSKKICKDLSSEFMHIIEQR